MLLKSRSMYTCSIEMLIFFCYDVKLIIEISLTVSLMGKSIAGISSKLYARLNGPSPHGWVNCMQ